MKRFLILFLFAATCGPAYAGSWGIDSSLTSHTAYTETSKSKARLMVDFAQGNQCEPEIIVSLDIVQLKPDEMLLNLQVDQRKEHLRDIRSKRSDRVYFSFVKQADQIVTELKAGSRARVLGPAAATFSLSGSSAAINSARQRCQALR